MQTLVEAAAHIAQEIDRTRQHLTNLEQALNGLKPLITVDAATTTLTYAMPAQAQPVEDLSVVNAEVPAKKKAKSKVSVEPITEKVKTAKTKVPKAKAEVSAPEMAPTKLPATGAELWLKCIGRKKVTVAQMTDAALKTLNLDDAAREVIATRAKAWTYAAAKKGTLIEAGMRDGSKLYKVAPAQEESTAQSVQAVEAVAVMVGAVEVAPLAEGNNAA